MIFCIFFLKLAKKIGLELKGLEKIDVTDISPTARVAGAINVSREDGAIDFEKKADIVNLFPENKNNYAKVRSVM